MPVSGEGRTQSHLRLSLSHTRRTFRKIRPDLLAGEASAAYQSGMSRFTEPVPLTEEDRSRQRKRASRFKYRKQFALTILCDDETDQKRLFAVLTKDHPERNIRVVVS